MSTGTALTRIRKLPVASFPLASVAVTSTSVVPTGNLVPDSWLSSMIGSGSRAEKIRTYRWKENIVVDHRLGGGSGAFNLSEVMAGRLQPMIDELIEQDTAQRLAAL